MVHEILIFNHWKCNSPFYFLYGISSWTTSWSLSWHCRISSILIQLFQDMALRKCGFSAYACKKRLRLWLNIHGTRRRILCKRYETSRKGGVAAQTSPIRGRLLFLNVLNPHRHIQMQESVISDTPNYGKIRHCGPYETCVLSFFPRVFKLQLNVILLS